MEHSLLGTEPLSSWPPQEQDNQGTKSMGLKIRWRDYIHGHQLRCWYLSEGWAGTGGVRQSGGGHPRPDPPTPQSIQVSLCTQKPSWGEAVLGGGEHGKDKQTRRSPREEKTTLTKTLNFESTKFKFRVTLPKTKFYLEENKVPWSGKIKRWFASLFTPSFYFSLSISPIFGIGTMRIQFGYRRVKMYSMLTHVERIWLPRLNVGSWKGL